MIMFVLYQEIMFDYSKTSTLRSFHSAATFPLRHEHTEHLKVHSHRAKAKNIKEKFRFRSVLMDRNSSKLMWKTLKR